MSGFMEFWGRPDECPDLADHRGPQGPNEDLAQCPRCLRITWAKRPSNETFGLHASDCSLPVDHDSYCEPGGTGHAQAAVIRG